MARHPALLEREGRQAAHHQAADGHEHHADDDRMVRPRFVEREAHHQRDQRQQRSGRRRHAGEIGAGPGGRRRVGNKGGVEPREAQRRAHREHESDDPAQRPAIGQRRHVEDQRRRHAEAKEVGERIELRAEPAGDAQPPRHPAVQRIEHRRHHDGDDGALHLPLQAVADRRQARAQRRQRQHVGDQPVDREAAQPAAAGAKVAVHRELLILPQRHLMSRCAR